MKFTYGNEVDYNEIMLDPYNPRFNGEMKRKSQSEILHYIQHNRVSGEDYIELFRAMKNGIRWMSFITIRPLKDLDKEMLETLELSETEKEQYKYIVIEGNTRLACLKSGEFSDVQYIPVTIFELEEGDINNIETMQKYALEILYIQAQNNITRVKEWGNVAFCYHIYNTFNSRRKFNPEERIEDVVNNLAERFTGKVQDIKKAIIRCEYVESIQKITGEVFDEKLWAYLEALESPAARTHNGMDLIFQNNCNEVNYSKTYQDNMVEFYELASEKSRLSKEQGGINSKDFRKYYREYITSQNPEYRTKREKSKGSVGTNTKQGNINKLNMEYDKHKRIVNTMKCIKYQESTIYEPQSEVDVYASYVLLRDKFPELVSLDIRYYSPTTTYDSLIIGGEKTDDCKWCDFKRYLENQIAIDNFVDNLDVIVCWEIPISDRKVGKFVGKNTANKKIALLLQKDHANKPGFLYYLENKEHEIVIPIIELKDLWEDATGQRFT